MSFKTTALLFGILMGMFWVFGLLMTLQKRKLDPGLVVPTLARDRSVEIDTVEVERGSKKYVFVKTDAGWFLTLPGSTEKVRADAEKVRELIDQVRKARRSDAPDFTRNLAREGLEAPTTKVVLKKGGDRQWTVYLGRESDDKAYIAANSSDRPRDVLPVARDQIESVLIDAKTINSYRSLRLLDVTDSNAKILALKQPAHPKAPQVVLEKGTLKHWRFKQPSAYGPADFEGVKDAKDPSGVRGLLNTLDAIRVESDKDFEPLDRELVDPSKALLRVEVELTGTRKGAPTKQVLLISPKDKDHYYARLESDKGAARVAAKNVEALLKFANHPASLRSREVAQLDPSAVDVVRISEGKGLTQVVTLYKAPVAGWKVASGAFRHKANESTIQGNDGLLSTIEGKGQVKDFIDVPDEAKQGAAKDKELGLDHPVAKVEVLTDGLEKEQKEDKKDEKKAAKKDGKKDEKKVEKKDAKKDEKKPASDEPRINPKAAKVTLLFGKSVGENVYVKRETSEGISRVSVPKSVLEKVAPARGALAFLDTNIAPFLVADVAKLELHLTGGRTFVVEREKEKPKAKDKEKEKDKFHNFEPTKWLLLKPDMKGRPHADARQVESVLNALATLSPREWVKQVGPKEDLSAYGLKAPTVTATVTLAKKEGAKEPSTFVYEFGSDTKKDKAAAGVFALIQGTFDLKNIVFVAPAGSVQLLTNAEFRDRTIFKFDVDKVKEIKLSIVEKSGETREPVFARNPKDRSWSIKSGLGKFNLDTERVEELARDLSKLEAMRFVSFGGVPDKKQELGDKAKVKIEVLMDDDKTRHHLTVGAREGAGSFVQASSLPGAVVTVASNFFDPIVNEGVGYFSKK